MNGKSWYAKSATNPANSVGIELDLFSWAAAKAPTHAPPPTAAACEACGAFCTTWTRWGQFEQVCHHCRAGEPAPVVAPAIVASRAPLINAEGFAFAPLSRELRDYQQQIREAVHRAFLADGLRRALVVAATGAGKTVCFSALAADWAPRRVLILTDQTDLVDQAIRNIKATTAEFADAEQGSREASMNARVVVATVQTLASKRRDGTNRMDRFSPDYFDLVVCDECDRAVAPVWKKVLARFEGHARVLGVTATPKREDKKDILKYFEKKVFEIGTLELIQRGFLSEIDVQPIDVRIDLTEAEASEDEDNAGVKDYAASAVAKALAGVYRSLCEQIKLHAADRKILIFWPNVETSEKFVEVALSMGLAARHVDGSSEDRKELQQGFRDRQFQILSNPCFLGRGYDDPSIDCVINMRATKSLAFYQQAIGRGTRLYCPNGCPGPCQHPDRKKNLLVLDPLCQFKGMGPIRPAELIAETPAQAAAMKAVQDRTQGRLNLRDMAEQARRDIEFSLLRALDEAQKAKGKRGSGEYFNAFQWAAQLHQPDLMDYTPETPAEAAPVRKGLHTELVKAGFVRESITCQGHAEKIMAVVQARREAGLCSFKQMFWLRKWGYKDPENITRERAEKILNQEFRRSGKF